MIVGPEACRHCGSTELGEVLCDPPSPHYSRVICRACSRTLGWGSVPLTPERAAAFVMPFGRFAGSTLARIGASTRGRSYLRWLLDEADLTPSARRAIETHLEAIER